MGFGSVKPHITNRADTAGAAVYGSRIGRQRHRIAVAGDHRKDRLDCAAVSGDAQEHHLLIDPGVLGQRGAGQLFGEGHFGGGPGGHR